MIVADGLIEDWLMGMPKTAHKKGMEMLVGTHDPLRHLTGL